MANHSTYAVKNKLVPGLPKGKYQQKTLTQRIKKVAQHVVENGRTEELREQHQGQSGQITVLFCNQDDNQRPGDR